MNKIQPEYDSQGYLATPDILEVTTSNLKGVFYENSINDVSMMSAIEPSPNIVNTTISLNRTQMTELGS